jgi:hypothetical protein
MKTPFDHMGKSVGCVCFPDEPDCCACPDGEAVLGAFSRDDCPLKLAPMTIDQRAWCIEQIESLEGHKADAQEAIDDSELAAMVLVAWADYARDKGLL